MIDTDHITETCFICALVQSCHAEAKASEVSYGLWVSVSMGIHAGWLKP